jgi:hypothetical protein
MDEIIRFPTNTFIAYPCSSQLVAFGPFILSGDPAGNPMFMEERSLHLYWAMTGAAARYGVNIAPYTYMSWDDNLFDARGKMLAGLQQIMARHTVLGFVFWNRGMPRSEHYTRMIQRLLYLGEPVSVIDEVGEVDFALRLVAADRLLVVPCACDRRCGLDIGLFRYYQC